MYPVQDNCRNMSSIFAEPPRKISSSDDGVIREKYYQLDLSATPNVEATPMILFNGSWQVLQMEDVDIEVKTAFDGTPTANLETTIVEWIAEYKRQTETGKQHEEALFRAGEKTCVNMSDDLRKSYAKNIFLIARHQDKIVSLLQASVGTNIAVLLSVVNHPHCLKHSDGLLDGHAMKGIGSLMMDRFLSYLRSTTTVQKIFSHADSLPSIALHEKFGFAEQKEGMISAPE